MKRASIQQNSEKDFRVLLGDKEIGKATNDVDARFHMHAINDALDVAYLEGRQYLERMVENARVELEIQNKMLQARIEQDEEIERQREERKQVQTSGPQCKKCGAFTTKTRVESHGMCMKCEHEDLKAKMTPTVARSVPGTSGS